MLSWYARKLETHPITTKSITSGIIAGAGDFICQCLVDKPAFEHQRALELQAGKAVRSVEDEAPLWWWNAARTGNFLLLGGAMVGPALHYWYGALATRFPLVEGAKTSAAAVRAILSRVALDQFLFTPLFVPVLDRRPLDAGRRQRGTRPPGHRRRHAAAHARHAARHHRRQLDALVARPVRQLLDHARAVSSFGEQLRRAPVECLFEFFHPPAGRRGNARGSRTSAGAAAVGALKKEKKEEFVCLEKGDGWCVYCGSK